MKKSLRLYRWLGSTNMASRLSGGIRNASGIGNAKGYLNDFCSWLPNMLRND